MRPCGGKDNPLRLSEGPPQPKIGFNNLFGEPCRSRACDLPIKSLQIGDRPSPDSADR